MVRSAHGVVYGKREATPEGEGEDEHVVEACWKGKL